MAKILVALDDQDVLDGPPSPRAIFTWQRARLERPLAKKARVRVRGLRNNGHVVSPEECALIARALERHPDEFVRSFGAFCAAADAGIADGEDPDEPDPWSPPTPPFREDADVARKIAARCEKALAIAKAEGEMLEHSLGGLEILDRMSRKKRDADESRSLAVYAVDSIRRIHGGAWGLAAEKIPAVRLSSGVVVELLGVGMRFDDADPDEWPYTLRELGETPVQM